MSVTREDLKVAGNPLWLSWPFYPPEVQTQLDLGSRYGATLLGLKHKVVPCEIYDYGASMLRKVGFQEVIHGDAVLAVDEFIRQDRKFDVITGFDFLEHVEKAKGEHLLDKIEAIAAIGVFWFIPEENDEIRARPAFIKYREEAYAIHVPADHVKYQSHRADWVPSELEAHGYTTFFLPHFHMIGSGAFFAAKYKEPYNAVMLARFKEEPLLWWGRDFKQAKPGAKRLARMISDPAKK